MKIPAFSGNMTDRPTNRPTKQPTDRRKDRTKNRRTKGVIGKLYFRYEYVCTVHCINLFVIKEKFLKLCNAYVDDFSLFNVWLYVTIIISIYGILDFNIHTYILDAAAAEYVITNVS